MATVGAQSRTIDISFNGPNGKAMVVSGTQAQIKYKECVNWIWGPSKCFFTWVGNGVEWDKPEKQGF